MAILALYQELIKYTKILVKKLGFFWSYVYVSDIFLINARSWILDLCNCYILYMNKRKQFCKSLAFMHITINFNQKNQAHSQTEHTYMAENGFELHLFILP